MTGPKTNEGATRQGERAGTKCTVRYVRASATKAREVLDLIRGKDAVEADQILQFTERAISEVVRKALASAIANAQHNDQQDPEALYVVACFADEGPTLKRYRPRARGRAARIRKRTCHVTVVVAPMTEEMLEHRRRKDEARPQAGRRRTPSRAAISRRERVARSRQAAAAARGQVAHDHEHEDVAELEAVEDADEAIDAELEPEATDVDVSDDVEIDAEDTAGEEQSESDADEDTGGEGSARRSEQAARGESEADAEPAEDADAEPHAGTGGEGSASDEPHAARGGSEADAEPADEGDES
jgi:large subunit ribosomal protein L22